MTRSSTQVPTARRTAAAWLALGLPALAAALLALAAHPALAGDFSAKDSDAIGVWTGDAKDPNSRFEVVAGAQSGELKLIPPPTQKVGPIPLHRISPNRFVSTQGVQPDASLTLTSPQHARLKVHSATKTGIGFTYLLVAKQKP